MKLSWFLKFLAIAFCIKFVIGTLVSSFVLASILGYKREQNVGVYSLILGIVLGIESVGLQILFGALPGVSVFLHIFRIFGIVITNGFSYATVEFVSFAWIVLFEIAFVTFCTKIAQQLASFTENRHLLARW